MKIKKLMSLLAAAVMTVTASNLIYTTAADGDKTGSCGENATWSFNETTGVLTISGTGDMYTNYVPVEQWEYYQYKDKIKEVVVEEGITYISECAFGAFDPSLYSEPSAYPNLTKLTLPSTLKSIGSYAFYKSGIEKINFSEGLEKIEEAVFACTSLSGNLVLPPTLNDIRHYSFYNTGISFVELNEGMFLGGKSFANCNSLKEVTIPNNIYFLETPGSNAMRPNAAFLDCKTLEKVIIKGGGLVGGNKDNKIENGLGELLFYACTSLKEIEIESEDIAYLGANGSDYQTFDLTNNPTFKVYKESTTEQTLKDAGYLTTENTVYYDVDTTELEDVISKAKEKDTSRFTDESVNLFEKELANAESILNQESPLPSLVNEAIKSLKDAMDELIEKTPEPSNNSPTDSTSSTASSTKKPPTTATSAKTNEKQVKQEHTKYINAIKKAKVAKPKVKSKSKKKLKITWKKISKATGYQIQVSKKKNFKINLFNKQTTKNKITFSKKLKSKKTYFVKVRAYYTYKNSKNEIQSVYSKWSKKLKVKMK